MKRQAQNLPLCCAFRASPVAEVDPSLNWQEVCTQLPTGFWQHQEA